MPGIQDYWLLLSDGLGAKREEYRLAAGEVAAEMLAVGRVSSGAEMRFRFALAAYEDAVMVAAEDPEISLGVQDFALYKLARIKREMGVL